MDEQLHPILNFTCGYLFMLGLKSIRKEIGEWNIDGKRQYNSFNRVFQRIGDGIKRMSFCKRHMLLHFLELICLKVMSRLLTCNELFPEPMVTPFTGAECVTKPECVRYYHFGSNKWKIDVLLFVSSVSLSQYTLGTFHFISRWVLE